MKLNKWLIISSIIIVAISVIHIILFTENAIVESIGISLLTGSIVSMTTSVLYYVYERNRIISQIRATIPNLYINISVIKELTGIMLPQVLRIQNLNDLEYRRISSLADMNISFINECGCSDYCGITKKSKTEKSVMMFAKYTDELRTLKFCLGKLEYWALDADTLYNTILHRQISGQEVSMDEQNLLIEKRNLVNVQTAKAHEYEASLLIKLDEIAVEFYGKKNAWEDRKKELHHSVEGILREARKMQSERLNETTDTSL